MRFLPWIAAGLATISQSALAQTDKSCSERDPSISWKVSGRLSIFRGDEARARADRLVEQIAAKRGRLVDANGAPSDSAYSEIVATLVDRSADPATARPLYLQTYWDRPTERYVDREQWLRPAHATIVATFSAAGDCTWTVDGVDQAGSCAGQPLRIVRVSPAEPLQAQVAVRASDGRSGRTCARIDEKLVLGFGDSYASGEGNPDRPTQWTLIPGVEKGAIVQAKGRAIDTLWDRNRRGPLAKAPPEADAQWWDNSCHRSLLSQQSLAAMHYAAADPHRIVTFVSFACSGATVIDGIVGPRFEAPGVSRRTKVARLTSSALRSSQIEQALQLLCAPPLAYTYEPIPPELRVWRSLKRPNEPATEKTGQVRVARCTGPSVAPDILLLSVGGNDVGFGGVGYWAIMPPKDRGWLPVDFVAGSSISADRKAAKVDFGLVCPFHTDERRCKKSGFTAETLLGELPGVYALMDDVLRKSGLGAVPVKVQMSYPPVALDEEGELCRKLWLTGTSEVNEMRNEPWMPLYNQVLDTYRIGSLTPAVLIAPWDFGIRNEVDLAGCIDREWVHSREMCAIYRDVYLPLNRAAADNPRAGWTVIDAARLPDRHGLCAASTALSKAIKEYDDIGDKVQVLARAEFGWPRYRKGWLAAWPAPTRWDAYAPRARWYRTATDSALTQTAFDGGTRAAGAPRTPAERLEESTSGTIHPTLQMHAAMAEQLGEEMRKARPVQGD
jgi:hypothetical protein